MQQMPQLQWAQLTFTSMLGSFPLVCQCEQMPSIVVFMCVLL
jgi:hypothetical protein